MEGREADRENDLFFVCSIIECIGRLTKNRRGVIAEKLGHDEISRLLKLAGVLHCEPVESTANELIKRLDITEGDFDNVSRCKYTLPTYFDIAKVYKRLIVNVADTQNATLSDALMRVYTSWISDSIDNYNSSMYFENPQYIYESYAAGRAL